MGLGAGITAGLAAMLGSTVFETQNSTAGTVLTFVSCVLVFAVGWVLFQDWLASARFNPVLAKDQQDEEYRKNAVDTWKRTREGFLRVKHQALFPKNTLATSLKDIGALNDEKLDMETAVQLITDLAGQLTVEERTTLDETLTLWFICAEMAILLGQDSEEYRDPAAVTDAFMDLLLSVSSATGRRVIESPTNILAVLEVSVRRLEDSLNSLVLWQETHPAPTPQPYGISPAGAEMWVRDWMSHMGAEGAAVTQLSGDGGIDVTSHRFLAQVKLYTQPVPIGAVRELAGVATHDPEHRTALFFASSSFSSEGVKFAHATGIALFIFNVEAGRVEGANSTGKLFAQRGFMPSPHP